MRVAWKDIFIIIEQMFDLNQDELAAHLEVDPGTISKIKRGTTRKFTARKPDKIYELIFDPYKSDSLAYKNGLIEKELFSLLKDAIADNRFQVAEDMERLWTKDYENGDYKIFVTKMLERTVRNQLPKETLKWDLLHHPLTSVRLFAAQHLREKFSMNNKKKKR